MTRKRANVNHNFHKRQHGLKETNTKTTSKLLTLFAHRLLFATLWRRGFEFGLGALTPERPQVL